MNHCRGEMDTVTREGTWRGISAASLRTGKRQVETEKHGELLQGRFLWVPKAVVLTVTFFLEPQLDVHNQGRN